MAPCIVEEKLFFGKNFEEQARSGGCTASLA
jgi:hypothetical protein